MRRLLLGLVFLLFVASPLLAQTAVTLAWDANTETNLGGYKAYWGLATRVYGTPVTLGKVTTYKVTNLPCGQNLFFAVTAIDTSTPPMESGYSNEVTTKLMCAPVNLKITGTSVTELQRKEATLVAETNIPANTSVALSYYGDIWTATVVDTTPGLEHAIRLTNLRPHTAYRYRWTATLADGSQISTAEGRFSTQ